MATAARGTTGVGGCAFSQAGVSRTLSDVGFPHAPERFQSRRAPDTGDDLAGASICSVALPEAIRLRSIT